MSTEISEVNTKIDEHKENVTNEQMTSTVNTNDTINPDSSSDITTVTINVNQQETSANELSSKEETEQLTPVTEATSSIEMTQTVPVHFVSDNGEQTNSTLIYQPQAIEINGEQHVILQQAHSETGELLVLLQGENGEQIALPPEALSSGLVQVATGNDEDGRMIALAVSQDSTNSSMVVLTDTSSINTQITTSNTTIVPETLASVSLTAVTSIDSLDVSNNIPNVKSTTASVTTETNVVQSVETPRMATLQTSTVNSITDTTKISDNKPILENCTKTDNVAENFKSVDEQNDRILKTITNETQIKNNNVVTNPVISTKVDHSPEIPTTTDSNINYGSAVIQVQDSNSASIENLISNAVVSTSDDGYVIMTSSSDGTNMPTEINLADVISANSGGGQTFFIETPEGLVACTAATTGEDGSIQIVTDGNGNISPAALSAATSGGIGDGQTLTYTLQSTPDGYELTPVNQISLPIAVTNKYQSPKPKQIKQTKSKPIITTKSGETILLPNVTNKPIIAPTPTINAIQNISTTNNTKKKPLNNRSRTNVAVSSPHVIPVQPDSSSSSQTRYSSSKFNANSFTAPVISSQLASSRRTYSKKNNIVWLNPEPRPIVNTTNVTNSSKSTSPTITTVTISSPTKTNVKTPSSPAKVVKVITPDSPLKPTVNRSVTNTAFSGTKSSIPSSGLTITKTDGKNEPITKSPAKFDLMVDPSEVLAVGNMTQKTTATITPVVTSPVKNNQKMTFSSPVSTNKAVVITEVSLPVSTGKVNLSSTLNTPTNNTVTPVEIHKPKVNISKTKYINPILSPKPANINPIIKESSASVSVTRVPERSTVSNINISKNICKEKATNDVKTVQSNASTLTNDKQVNKQIITSPIKQVTPVPLILNKVQTVETHEATKSTVQNVKLNSKENEKMIKSVNNSDDKEHSTSQEKVTNVKITKTIEENKKETNDLKENEILKSLNTDEIKEDNNQKEELKKSNNKTEEKVNQDKSEKVQELQEKHFDEDLQVKEVKEKSEKSQVELELVSNSDLKNDQDKSLQNDSNNSIEEINSKNKRKMPESPKKSIDDMKSKAKANNNINADNNEVENETKQEEKTVTNLDDSSKMNTVEQEKVDSPKRSRSPKKQIIKDLNETENKHEEKTLPENVETKTKTKVTRSSKVAEVNEAKTDKSDEVNKESSMEVKENQTTEMVNDKNLTDNKTPTEKDEMVKNVSEENSVDKNEDIIQIEEKSDDKLALTEDINDEKVIDETENKRRSSNRVPKKRSLEETVLETPHTSKRVTRIKKDSESEKHDSPKPDETTSKISSAKKRVGFQEDNEFETPVKSAKIRENKKDSSKKDRNSSSKQSKKSLVSEKLTPILKKTPRTPVRSIPSERHSICYSYCDPADENDEEKAKKELINSLSDLRSPLESYDNDTEECSFHYRHQSESLNTFTPRGSGGSYSCQKCGYRTSRMNNLVLHHKDNCPVVKSAVRLFWESEIRKQTKRSSEESTPSSSKTDKKFKALGLDSDDFDDDEPEEESVNTFEIFNKEESKQGPIKVSTSTEQDQIMVMSDDEEERYRESMCKKFGFTEKEIVWAQYDRIHWPALVIKIDEKEEDVKLLLIDKKCITMSIDKVLPFDDADRNKRFLTEGKTSQGDKIVNAVQKAEDYSRKRCLGNDVGAAKVFGKLDLEYREPLSDEERLEREDNICESERRISEDETSGNDLSTTQSNEKYVEITETLSQLKEKRKASNAKLLQCIKDGKVETHLLGVYRESIDSDRHGKFKSGSESEKNQLKHVPWFGPIDDEDQQEEIYDYCSQLFKSNFKPEGKFDTVAYLFEVWVPEAIVKAISRIRHLELDKAEEIFSQGVILTKSEKDELEKEIKKEAEKHSVDKVSS